MNIIEMNNGFRRFRLQMKKSAWAELSSDNFREVYGQSRRREARLIHKGGEAIYYTPPYTQPPLLPLQNTTNRRLQALLLGHEAKASAHHPATEASSSIISGDFSPSQTRLSRRGGQLERPRHSS